MTRRSVVALFLLFVSGPILRGADDRVKMYVFAEPNVSDSRTGDQVPATITDSVEDLRRALRLMRMDPITYGYGRRWLTDKRSEAEFLVRLTGREEARGEYRVYVHLTTRDGRQVELTGTSAHQWRQSADDLATQLVTIAMATEAGRKQRRE